MNESYASREDKHNIVLMFSVEMPVCFTLPICNMHDSYLPYYLSIGICGAATLQVIRKVLASHTAPLRVPLETFGGD
jgi:hypothetical protein